MTTDRVPDDEALAARLRASRVLEDAPEALIQRALGLWRAGETPATSPASVVSAGLRRLVASLKFDSATRAPTALGLRSAAGTTRQLIYFSEGRDIDVRVAAVHAAGGLQWRIAGQVLGPDTAGMAELRSGGQARTASWSELGEFSFGDVAAGQVTLVLRSSDWELELPAFDVPA
jgi:hypothetical protein